MVSHGRNDFRLCSNVPKGGRNDPCHCGSGKKKRCCGGATVNRVPATSYSQIVSTPTRFHSLDWNSVTAALRPQNCGSRIIVAGCKPPVPE
jgi:hypothetical protein